MLPLTTDDVKTDTMKIIQGLHTPNHIDARQGQQQKSKTSNVHDLLGEIKEECECLQESLLKE
jgi:hypothetical protein